MQRHGVGILGATGLVGQRLVSLLDGHPWFETRVLGASRRSSGRRYGEACRWGLTTPAPRDVADRTLVECDPERFAGCDIVFSALGSRPAEAVERSFAAAGVAVVSNSSAFRMAEDVPLVIPEINPDHLDLIETQPERRTGGGFVVTNPNCSIIGLALALAPFRDDPGIRAAVVSTMQAVSGAGADGPRTLELVDNVLPFIAGEEEKMQSELAKIFGTIGPSGVEPAPVKVSAHCHRVATIDGHLESLSLQLRSRLDPDQAIERVREWRGALDRPLPSSPDILLDYREEADRPQPRLDRDRGDGMTVVVGRIRDCPVLDLRMTILSHNTIRGAAGAALLNAELLAARGRLPGGSAS